MFNFGQVILSSAMILTAMWIAYKYLYLFGDKKKTNIFGVCTWWVYAIYQLIVECYRGTPSIWKLVFGIILIYFVSVSNFHWKTRNVIFTVCQFYSIWAIIEMIVFWIIQIIVVGDESKKDVMGVVISKIVMIILVFFVSVHKKTNNDGIVSFKYNMFLLFVPLGSIYISHVIFIEQNINSLSCMIAFSILLMLNVIIFELYDKLAEIYRLENEKIVYEKQFEILSRSTEEQRKIREEFHEERHNLNNKLIVLKKSIEKYDKNTAMEVIDRIINVNTESKFLFSTGNEIVDAIINVKHIVAKEYDIQFKCKIFVPEILPIKQCDIGIVLGNAIDNAIEAVKDCKISKKNIDISIGVKKESLVIIIKNPFEHTLLKNKNGDFLSTKSAKEHHGFGLKSIYKVAEQYGGEVITSVEDNSFTIMIFLNLP